jgi:arginine decarboxylase
MIMTNFPTKTWTPERSAELYGIHNWGAGFFDLNANGEVIVKVPFPDGEASVSLMEIVAGVEQRGHVMPLLLRIENLLDISLTRLNEAFRRAIASAGYNGDYRGVFPIKVNQQCQVIEELTGFGARYSHGLEAGSKAEMIIALAHLQDDGLLILNGSKDREFIDLGLWADKLGYRCFFVIESPGELNLLIERSRALGVQPLVGARVKVSAKVGGLWTETTGDRSSFGLSTAQLVAVVDTLRDEGMLDCLQLLHCHLGSQIPDLEDIRAGVSEACRFYTGLVAEGAPMGYLDLGGGLAVDYIGGNAVHVHSRNYTLDDYCRAIVGSVANTLDPLGINHPQLVTESGRATVAYSSLLLFNILDVMRFEPISLPQQLAENAPDALKQLFAMNETHPAGQPEQAYTAALACRDRMRELFRGGEVSLRQRSAAENLFLAVSGRILENLAGQENLSETLSAMKLSLSDIYYGNFSVFQSLPDTWAIDQVFPVMPLHRHTERPEREATLSDLTCDCDGKLDRFFVHDGERDTLPVHNLRKGEEYLLGVFLMGAYQETLGDLHNLFGDTHVASVRINPDGSFDVMKEINGDTIGDVLEMVEYRSDLLFETFRERAEEAVRKGRINLQERRQMVEDYAANLQGYTYYER